MGSVARYALISFSGEAFLALGSIVDPPFCGGFFLPFHDGALLFGHPFMPLLRLFFLLRDAKKAKGFEELKIT